jgi:hypothetical protein
MNRILVLRVVLVVVCVAHIVLGLIGYAAPAGPLTWAVETFYHASLTLTPELQHVIRILGAFMLAIGVMAGFACWKPEQNRYVIAGIVALLVLRVSQRLIFAEEINRVFQVPYWHIWGQAAFYFALAVVLFFLRPRESQA